MAFLLALVILFSSCHTKREIRPKRLLAKKDNKELLDGLKKNEAALDQLSIKSKVHFKTSKMSDSFKMHVRMKKDSIIWISATYYKVEVARFLFSPDSVKMLDRKASKYYIGDYSFVQEKFQMPFDFKALQAVILGNSFDVSNSDKVRNYTSRGKYVLSAMLLQTYGEKLLEDKSNQVKRIYTMWIDPESFRVSKSKIVESKSKKSLVTEYSKWQNVEGFSIPHKAIYHVFDKDEMTFDAEYVKVESKKELNYPFSISSKYEPFF